MRTKHPILRRDISRRQSRIERFRRCLCSVCDAGPQRGGPLKGVSPEGSLKRLGEQSRYLTVVWNASMSEPRHPLCEGDYTRLVGLRRSLARKYDLQLKRGPPVFFFFPIDDRQANPPRFF